jgi:predicted metalloprotease with PDZ domain
VSDVEKIVRYENSVFGPPPLEMYTFLFNIGYPGGDGMEHLYSTQIIDRRPWQEDAQLLPGINSAAHEYFHVWNVKRVRPIALGPFDYTREQYQPSLWVAEGWTQYYGQVALYRAGVLPSDGFYNMVANNIVRPNLTAPGRKEVSARMASFEAPFWDGAQPGYAVDPNNFFSYYTKGAGLALYFDLLIRSRSGGTRSLDDAFRNLRHLSWEQPNASYYLQGRGYTEADVEQAVSEAAGTNLHDWFATHVGGTEDPDFDEALGWAGLRLVRGDGGWSIEEVPNATPAQLRVRAGWISGHS